MLVQDIVDAMLFGINNAREPVNLFNLGYDNWIDVTSIADIVVEEMGLSGVQFSYTGGKRGWKGDVPKIRLSVEKINALGWQSSP